MADFVAGDTNRLLRVTATFPTALDVTGATASLVWKIETQNAKIGSVTTSPMTNLIPLPSAGSATTLSGDYLFTANQLKVGTLIARMRVTIGGLVIHSDSQLKYQVEAVI